MGLAIFLRKRAQVNRFRDVVIDSINAGVGTKSTLCSGFFQEMFKSSPYCASAERNLALVLANNGIELTTIGIHNNTWLPSYKNFRNSLRNAGVNILAKYSTSFHWHAKIFILKQVDDPILAVVGSSNITRNAFSVSSPHNVEADVFMWRDSILPLTTIIEGMIAATIEDPHEVIVADYDPHRNANLTIDDRLKRLDAELKEYPLRDLPE